jgi:polyhydroxybutyrate depolymerase
MALKIVGALVGLTLIAVAAARFVLTDSVPPEQPALSSAIQHGAVRVGELERSYLFYAPANLAANPALLFVLHGARGTGRRMRVLTAYEFETLADRENFVVVYPDGFERYWNDCRKQGSFSAKTRNVDDVGFIHTLIDRFRGDFGIDAAHVFVMGFSNGGQMAFRLTLELPHEVTAIAAVASNLPTPENWACREAQWPVAVMIVNGTADPVNPYAGGRGWFGLAGSGGLRSTMETADYFKHVAGYQGPPEIHLYPKLHSNDNTWVERMTWRADFAPEVSVYTIHGGGHTIPQAKYRLRRILGPTATDIDCMQEIWAFFTKASEEETEKMGRPRLELGTR